MALNRLISSKAASWIVALVIACFAATDAFGTTYTFVQKPASPNPTWNGSANWVVGDVSPVPTADDGISGVPSQVGDVAILQQRVTPTTPSPNPLIQITLATTSQTIGVLTSRNTDNDWTTTIIANNTTPGTLIFDNGGDTAQAQLNESGPATTSSNSIRLRITAPVQLKSDLLINQTYLPDRNTVTEIAGKLTGTDQITITKVGAGSIQFGQASDGVTNTADFFGDVDVQEGLLRLIVPNNASPPNNINAMFSNSKGIYIHDGTQMQFGNGMNVFTLGSNPSTVDGKAELTLEGIGNSTSPNLLAQDGALRFDQPSGTAINCNVNNPIKLVATASHSFVKMYVASSDVAGILKGQVRGDATAGLIKGGPGLLKLAAPDGNTYAGSTDISKGLLSVNNTNSATSGVGLGASVHVDDTGSGAALGGTGYIGTLAHPVDVNLTGDASSTTGARLYPGDINTKVATIPDPSTFSTSVGTLTIHGKLTFDALSSLNIDLNHTSADKVVVDNTITLGGAGLNFNVGTPALDGTESFTLIDNQGIGTIAGQFGSVNGVAGTYSEGSTITLGSVSFRLTYAGGVGNNDVMLVPAALAGDFNGDSQVNAADYVTWRKNDGSDSGYAAFRENFNVGPASGQRLMQVAAVPEPATITLVVLIAPFFAPLAARRKFGRTRS